jgi:hypothetical protein
VACKNKIVSTPCRTCEEFLINPSTGEKGRKRLPEEKPRCEACPKVRYADDLSDDRVMQAIIYYHLGIDEGDDFLKKDPWMYVAVKIIKGFVAEKEKQDIKAQVEGGTGGRRPSWQR